jgi:hypothetical protein
MVRHVFAAVLCIAYIFVLSLERNNFKWNRSLASLFGSLQTACTFWHIAKLIKNDDEVLLYVFVFTHNLIQKVDQLFGIMLYRSRPASCRSSSMPPSRSSSATGLAAVFWLGFAAAFILRDWGRIFDVLLTDDALRLVQVRDFMAGQNWFDLVQYRLDPPNVTPMHWSRLMDVPIAAMIWLSGWLVDSVTAEKLALALWPPLLMLPALAAIITIVREAVGPETRKLGLLLFTATVTLYIYFSPGRIDHHNMQIVLLLWMVAGVLQAHRSLWAGCYAGLAGALSLAVGFETLPLIVVLCAGIAVLWVWQGAAIIGARAFCLSFGLGTLALFFLTIPPAHYFASACDALSLAQAAGAGVGGLGLAVAVLVRPQNTAARSIAAGIAGVAAVATTLGLAPQCLGNPLNALPPDVQAVWLANVSEAQNVFQTALTQPANLIYIYALPCAGVLIAFLAIWNSTGVKRGQWVILCSVQIVSLAITLWQIRGGAIAHTVMIPALVYMTRFMGKRGPAVDWEWMRPRSLVFALLMNGAAMVLVSFILLKPLRNQSDAESQKGLDLCTAHTTYLPLNHLPKGIIANPIDTGPFILAWTPHSVIAGPYHRQSRGLSDIIAVFKGSPAEAEAIIRRRLIDYVVVCEGSPEIGLYEPEADSTMARLIRGDIPRWLEPLPGKGALKIYRVIPQPELHK